MRYLRLLQKRAREGDLAKHWIERLDLQEYYITPPRFTVVPCNLPCPFLYKICCSKRLVASFVVFPHVRTHWSARIQHYVSFYVPVLFLLTLHLTLKFAQLLFVSDSSRSFVPSAVINIYLKQKERTHYGKVRCIKTKSESIEEVCKGWFSKNEST